LALRPLVISFFRGRRCPYCVTELEAWRDLYSVGRESGALLVGISTQVVRQSDFTVGQHEIPFPLLHDPHCDVAQQFGITYFCSILVNIPFMNGDESWVLPLPAIYVLRQDGTVLYAEAC
jgi:peroxiredoxin